MESQVEKGSPPPSPPPLLSTETSFLNRKKKEIVDRSMALFQSKLNVCLDNSASAAPGKQRPAKRARDDDDGGGSSSTPKPHSSEVSTRATRKKRVKRDEADVVRYACPFCKHNPAKYKHVKTCCGPGWEDVHRVK